MPGESFYLAFISLLLSLPVYRYAFQAVEDRRSFPARDWYVEAYVHTHVWRLTGFPLQQPPVSSLSYSYPPATTYLSSLRPGPN